MGNVRNSNPLNGCLQSLEKFRVTHDLGCDLCTGTAGHEIILHHYQSSCLLQRLPNFVKVQGIQATGIDDLDIRINKPLVQCALHSPVHTADGHDRHVLAFLADGSLIEGHIILLHRDLRPLAIAGLVLHKEDGIIAMQRSLHQALSVINAARVDDLHTREMHRHSIKGGGMVGTGRTAAALRPDNHRSINLTIGHIGDLGCLAEEGACDLIEDIADHDVHNGTHPQGRSTNGHCCKAVFADRRINNALLAELAPELLRVAIAAAALADALAKHHNLIILPHLLRDPVADGIQHRHFFHRHTTKSSSANRWSATFAGLGTGLFSANSMASRISWLVSASTAAI